MEINKSSSFWHQFGNAVKFMFKTFFDSFAIIFLIGIFGGCFFYIANISNSFFVYFIAILWIQFAVIKTALFKLTNKPFELKSLFSLRFIRFLLYAFIFVFLLSLLSFGLFVLIKIFPPLFLVLFFIVPACLIKLFFGLYYLVDDRNRPSILNSFDKSSKLAQGYKFNFFISLILAMAISGLPLAMFFLPFILLEAIAENIFAINWQLLSQNLFIFNLFFSFILTVKFASIHFIISYLYNYLFIQYQQQD